ncbi:hypothetical protein G195_007420 [Phytophthora kernoviae 00238/432]|uniref:NADPH-dependent FMN reductase-like domain-containing protein n=1 Tax=Phytophthora kernoviae 00238/432 TaxID=1284355 RepID=A0A8J4WCA6_9STRA|nr:hypothetical protein G195_007420 [Phytophthora kernoviae 00238/432]
MKIYTYVVAMALASGAVNAWTFDASDVAPPEDIVGEHQTLQRSWTISSYAQLEQLYVAVPGRVFVELDPSLLPATEAPETEAPATKAPETVAPATKTPETEAPVVPVGSLAGSGSGWNDSSLSGETIEIPSMMLRKHHHHKDEDEDEEQGEETVVAKIVVTGNSTDLLNMFDAVPLHPKRNDGLKFHLKNADAYGEGYVLTQIFLFNKNLLKRVTTTFSGDVVLNDDVVTLDNKEANLKLACVGDGNLFLESSANVSLSSLEVKVTGSGLAQVEIPSVILEGELYVEVAGSGSVAIISDALTADEVKSTLSGSGDIVVDTSSFEAQKLVASVYGSGITSFATAGAVQKETLTLSGPGQLLAGSIVAQRATADVWGNGEVLVQVTDKLTVSTSVWGKVGYVNDPPTDVKIKGWWFWREASSIVYPAAVNKVLIYEPATVPAKYPVYYSVETAASLLSNDPDYAFVSTELAESSSVADLMTMSLSNMHKEATGSHGLFYAFIGVGVVVVNVVAARSWSQRRVRRHYTRLAAPILHQEKKPAEKMAFTDAIIAPYAAAKDLAQSMNPVLFAAIVAVVVVVNVVAAKSWQARRNRLEYSPLLNNGDGLAGWLTSRFNAIATANTAPFKLVLASELMNLPLPIGPVTDPVIAAAIPAGEPQEYADPAVQAWSRTITAAPAIVVLTPQYNWGYPGHLKNLFDHLYTEWAGKRVVLVTYGGHNGSKCADQLQQVLTGGLHMEVIGNVGISLPKEFIRSTDRVDATNAPEFLAQYEAQVDAAFELLLKRLQQRLQQSEQK